MSRSQFRLQEHIVPGQHIRHYARATATSQEAVLRLAVNQYTPIDQPKAEPNAPDVTILACHANGFPKELYEPVWDELLEYARKLRTFRIRNIWIVDVTNQNASGVLNENAIGNEPSWFDSARDLLAVVNHFRAEMPRPIVGYGHSMGGATLTSLALIHPRLMSTLIATEPIINESPLNMNFAAAFAITFRKDQWPSRQVAEKAFRKKHLFKHWDERTFRLWMKYGLRDVPSSDQGGENAVTLVTTRHQEATLFARACYPPFGQELSTFRPSREHHPDIGSDRNAKNAFYRPEATMLFTFLPHLRPSCLFIYGAKSNMISASAEGRAAKLHRAGTGIDGSGGAAEGRVKDKVLQGSHFVPFEQPGLVAGEVGRWLSDEMQRWQHLEEAESQAWGAIPVNERNMVDQQWVSWMKHLYGPKDSKSKL